MTERHTRICVRLRNDIDHRTLPVLRGARTLLRVYPNFTAPPLPETLARRAWFRIPAELAKHIEEHVNASDRATFWRVAAEIAADQHAGLSDPEKPTLEWLFTL